MTATGAATAKRGGKQERLFPMARTVVNNSEVPHLWAHQSQSYAKGNGSISFSGRSI
jgi:hypothetical protein